MSKANLTEFAPPNRCGAGKATGTTHVHGCFLAKGHGGLHRCGAAYCGHEWVQSMKKEEMTKIVNEELKHIPRTGRHIFDVQAELRMFFNGLRREDLKLGKTKEDSLIRCIKLVKRSYPSWEPVFDNGFFNTQDRELVFVEE